MKCSLHVSSNPCGWIYAEYQPGKRVLASMLKSGLDRLDVQVNVHGVVLFYDALSAHQVLSSFVHPDSTPDRQVRSPALQ